MTSPLNLSYRVHDTALDDSLKVISNLTMIRVRKSSNPHTVNLFVTHTGDVVEARANDPQPMGLVEHGYTLDLIAHAPGGVLQFGEWEINASETSSTRLSERFERMRIKPKAIRLLGCNTGLFPAGQAAIRHLSQVFPDVQIFGTTGLLDGSDFDADGLTARSERSLRGNGHLPPPQDPDSEETAMRQFRMMAPGPDFDDLFNRLRPETLDEATYDLRYTPAQFRWRMNRFAIDDWRKVLDPLVPKLASAPGLLTAPEAEALLPAKSSSDELRFHRATLLLGGWFVRVYPIGVPAGVILRSGQRLTFDGGTPIQPPVTAATSPDET
jgi:hypothetical protein